MFLYKVTTIVLIRKRPCGEVHSREVKSRKAGKPRQWQYQWQRLRQQFSKPAPNRGGQTQINWLVKAIVTNTTTTISPLAHCNNIRMGQSSTTNHHTVNTNTKKKQAMAKLRNGKKKITHTSQSATHDNNKYKNLQQKKNNVSLVSQWRV